MKPWKNSLLVVLVVITGCNNGRDGGSTSKTKAKPLVPAEVKPKVIQPAIHHAPLAADKIMTVYENTPLFFEVNDFGFNDVDVNDTLASVVIKRLPERGRLHVANQDVTAGQVIPVGDIARLVFIPATNDVKDNYANFCFHVIDRDGIRSVLDYTLTLNVVPVGAVPTPREYNSTYVRCWYRENAGQKPHQNDDVSSTYEWATNEDGSSYSLPGYWYSKNFLEGVFYTDVSQEEVQKKCDDTLDGLRRPKKDRFFSAANNVFSFNYSIWTNDKDEQPLEINKIVSFGDSLSDTGNLFNALNWRFPNRYSWFSGRFTNGFVWTEYFAKALQIPLYTWSFGGAAGITEHYFIPSIDNQIDSYINHTRMMKNYEPNNSLFVLQFGLNDFITYDRPVGDVDTNFAQALNKLIANGVNNILVINLPDPTHAPEFKYVDEKTIEKVKRNINAYNEYSKKRVEQHKAEGVNIALYDFYSLLESIVVYPEMFDFKNVTDSCLKINRSDYRDYLERHKLRRDCREKGSDSYVFWGVTHPTTRSHEIISQEVIRTSLDSFAIKKIR